MSTHRFAPGDTVRFAHMNERDPPYTIKAQVENLSDPFYELEQLPGFFAEYIFKPVQEPS